MARPSTARDGDRDGDRSGGTGLPAEVASFVGRRDELTAVAGLLTTSRLVTLVGAGGVGKTRLALRVAAGAVAAFPDGVRLVELAPLRDATLLPQSVVDALGIQEHSDRSPAEVLRDFLAERQLLLIVDNCEHLAAPCAALLEELLRTAPGLKVLATSRQPLGAAGEHLFAVSPLPVPALDRIPGPRVLCRNEAVELFRQRASAIRPGFAVTEENSATVARLVAALDGIPLAIELAAPWLRVLTLGELLDGLADRFALLDSGAVGPRHARRTLRELMDWSYDLCSPQERLLWARLSVFSGGFDLEAAEAVCSGDGIPRAAVLTLVAGLVDKSVLSRQETATGTRFRPLETVREYGAGRLASGEERLRLRRAHRDHVLALFRRAERQWVGPEQIAWFDRLRLDHDNLRTALEFCAEEPGEAEAGLALAAHPRAYWVALGSLREEHQWLRRLLAVAGDAGDVRTRAIGLDAWFTVLRGDLGLARTLLAEHRERAERLRDAEELAWAIHHSAVAIGLERLTAEAVPMFEEAIARHRALGNTLGVISALFELSLTESLVGDVQRGLVLSREAVAVAEAAGETFLRSYAVCAEGLALWMSGDRAAADTRLREAIRLKQPFRDRWGLTLCVQLSSWSAVEDGEYRYAAHLLGMLRALWEGLGATVLQLVPFNVGAHESYEARVREALGPRAFQAAFARGAKLTLEQITTEVLRAESRADPSSSAHPLTRRERQVAGLVAQGRSNKEIAGQLVISLRTAENHVEHILAKLGFTSRAQIAVWATEHEHSRAAGGRPQNPGFQSW
ncbi:ATP-binding protein [Streptacidiphilus fuscans]|uniref:LuxR family transcriptional regulator n=1 Tax=Streptacidiphilus fuscans TaxID=2789292 RepID=A0A931FCM4_9ACTN|nr:LuxR C-terminal-related transcriptional regulator [Streptacidiphilus fuscans]MBF9066621.1 LuxR family transcriptional regulator [Streptacidiphilus fuscans]